VGLEVVERAAAARRRRMKWRYCIEEDGRAEKGRKGKRPLGTGVKVQIDEQDLSAPPPVDACYTYVDHRL
jgi:hypothetical protein